MSNQPVTDKNIVEESDSDNRQSSVFDVRSLAFLRRMISGVLSDLIKIVKSLPVLEVLRPYLGEYGKSSDDEYHSFMSSFMSNRFHPVSEASFLPSMERDIGWFVSKGNLCPFPSDVTPTNLKEWLKSVKEVVGIVGVSGFVRTSNKEEEGKRGKKRGAPCSKPRKTCRAHFVLESLPEGSPFKYHPDRVRAIKLLAKLEGRLHNWGDAWLTAKALPMAKTGLVSVLADQFVKELSGSWENFVESYPATYSLLAVCCSVFSERKAFTLESQKQGALNTHMEQLLALARETEPSAMKIVALFLPVKDVFDMISVEDARTIYDMSMTWLGETAIFLEDQWSKGVAKCSRRQMRVPPKGSRVNSTGYNAVADTFQNLRRFQVVAAQRAGIEGAPVILKVLQLIADDQFRWGNGSVNPNTLVFKDITSNGVLPWHAVLHPETFDKLHAMTVLLEACRKHGVSIDSWLGLAKLRHGEVSHPVDMICGCAVPSMSSECADFLKELGLFGAGPYTGT